MKSTLNLKPSARPLYNKRHFDVRSARDLREYRAFLETGTWGKDGCPFVVEYPYSNIPDMIKNQVLETYLGSIISNLEKKAKASK